ncbi:MAG: isoaspartyl peptidase/L-asparaginase family protein, partial [Bacteroidota bacterium]
ELIDTGYFYTSGRLKQYQDTKIKGTVGCVAIDKQGNLCAGTSTGGRANKEHGRIGDSPIIGAGTYADNSTCAVSCTGHGEFFIRYCVAHDISALMKYKGLALQQAANHVIQDKLEKANGTGGIIAIDTMGNIAFSFNTTAMFRGYIDKDGEKVTAIF